jgi:nucleoid-associated protein YgaU
VAEGDTLATIAEKFYGDSGQWRRIYDANRSAIGENPDAVRIGTTLRIPPR